MADLAKANQKTETIFLYEDSQVSQDGFFLMRHFYLQDLADGNQHLIKFVMAGDFPICLSALADQRRLKG